MTILSNRPQDRDLRDGTLPRDRSPRQAGRWLLLLAAMVFGVAHAAPPTPVIVSAAASKPFEDKIEALGTLRANESVELTAAVAETVSALHFDDGQRVRAGQVLVEMTDDE